MQLKEILREREYEEQNNRMVICVSRKRLQIKKKTISDLQLVDV